MGVLCVFWEMIVGKGLMCLFRGLGPFGQRLRCLIPVT